MTAVAGGFVAACSVALLLLGLWQGRNRYWTNAGVSLACAMVLAAASFVILGGE